MITEIMVLKGLPYMHIAYIVLSLTSCSTNGILIWIILRKRNFRTMANLIIVSLCVSDFLLGLTIAPVEVIHTLWPDLKITGYACLAHQDIMIFVPLVSIFHLLIVALERFVKIVYPLRYPSIATSQRIIAFIITAWTVPFCISLTPFIHIEDNYANGNSTDSGCSSLDMLPCSYLFCVFSIIGAICLGIAIAYGIILRISFHHIKQIRCMTVRRFGQMKYWMEFKAVIVLIVTVGYFILSWTPFSAAVIEQCMSPGYPVYWFPSVFLAYFNSTINPMIYGIGNRELRLSLLKLCCRNNKTNLADRNITKLSTLYCAEQETDKTAF